MHAGTQKENQKKLRVAGCVFGGVTASQKAQLRNPQLCNFHRYGLTLWMTNDRGLLFRHKPRDVSVKTPRHLCPEQSRVEESSRSPFVP